MSSFRRNIDLSQYLVRAGSWAVAGRGTEGVLTILEAALLARLLIPGELGGYFLLFSLVTVSGTVGSLGLGQTVVRLVGVSAANGNDLEARGVILKVIGLGLFGAVLVAALVAGPVGRVMVDQVFKVPDLSGLLPIVAVMAALWALRTVFVEIFRGLGDIRMASLFSRLSVSLVVVPIFAWLWFTSHEADLRLVLLIQTVASFATISLGLFALVSILRDLDRDSGIGSEPRIVRTALPIFVDTLVTLVLINANLWLLGYLSSEESVALYGAAFRLATLVIMPLVLIEAVIAPLVARLYTSQEHGSLEKLLRVAAALMLSLGGAVGLVLVLFGRQVLSTVFEPYYGEAAVALSILVVGRLIVLATGSSGLTLVMTGHERLKLLITACTGTVSIIVGYLLISRYSLLGAAVSVAIGWALQHVAWWFAVKRKTGMWTHTSFADSGDVLREAKSLKQPTG